MMKIMLMSAIGLMTCALIFYTVGIFGERIKKTLKPWHCILLWLGFTSDLTGTLMMSALATDGASSNHSLVGAAALALMLGNAVWATYALYRHSDKAKQVYHKFSIFIWLIWLIPFCLGAMGSR